MHSLQIPKHLLLEWPGQSLLEGETSAFVTSDRNTCAHSVTDVSSSARLGSKVLMPPRETAEVG